MKKIILFVFAVMALSAWSSCVVLSPKKYKSLLAKQDSLSNGWTESQQKNRDLESLIARLRKDTIGLNSALNDLKGRYSEMDSNYAKLRSNSSSEINKLSSDLKNVSSA
jgi:chemotaxis protein MotB